MSIQSSNAGRAVSNRLRFVEFVYWVGVLTAIVTVIGSILSLLVGGGLVGLKYYLFLVGFLLFGLGSFGIQPKSPRLGTKGRYRQPVAKLFSFSIDGDNELWFEELIQDLPPLRDRPIALEERVSRNTKVFVTSLVVLTLSFTLEAGLGVAVG